MKQEQLRKIVKEVLALQAVPQLYDTKQTADMLRISPGTLNNWRMSGKGPAVTTAGGAVRYQLAAINVWLQENTSGRA